MIGLLCRVVVVLSVLLLAAGCGDDGGEGAADPPESPDTAESGGDAGDGAGDDSGSAVEIIDFSFEPQEITVDPGGTVTWTNRDEAAHTVADRSDLGAEESADLAQSDTFSLTYDEPGEYPYVCGIHNYMTGTVVVEQ